VVRFNETTYTVNETDEQVELCVIVSVPEDQNIGDVTFSLAVETKNGTASTSKILELITFWDGNFSFQNNSIIAAKFVNRIQ